MKANDKCALFYGNLISVTVVMLAVLLACILVLFVEDAITQGTIDIEYRYRCVPCGKTYSRIVRHLSEEDAQYFKDRCESCKKYGLCDTVIVIDK